MTRKLAAAFIIIGLAIGFAGWRLLPSAPGRLEYAVEIVDPRPPAQAAMPEGLKTLGAVRALVVDLPAAQNKARRLLLVPKLSKLLSSADTELGALPQNGRGEHEAATGPKAVAGAATGLGLGEAPIYTPSGDPSRPVEKAGSIDVVASLHHLGPLFDSALMATDSPAALEALAPLAGGASAHYFLLTRTAGERGRTLSKLHADARLLPAPNAQVLSPSEGPPASNAADLAVAAALLCGGLLVIGLQLRGVSRQDVARRFARR